MTAMAEVAGEAAAGGDTCPMQIGLAFPQMTPDLDRAKIVAWCQGVDDGPFSSISAGERVAFDNLDGFTLCSAAAALTERVRICFNVVVAPWHSPALLAKELATLDTLSGGRMHLGIGVGWLEEEFDALGVPFAKRGARTDDYVAAMRALWR